ncbi:hypothetical protein LEMLEM_LOCUS20003, partial [Lemmus lemmus]
FRKAAINTPQNTSPNKNETHLLLATTITSRGRWELKRLHIEFASHLGKKLLLSRLLDGMMCNLDMQDLQRNDC